MVGEVVAVAVAVGEVEEAGEEVVVGAVLDGDDAVEQGKGRREGICRSELGAPSGDSGDSEQGRGRQR